MSKYNVQKQWTFVGKNIRMHRNRNTKYVLQPSLTWTAVRLLILYIDINRTN